MVGSEEDSDFEELVGVIRDGNDDERIEEVDIEDSGTVLPEEVVAEPEEVDGEAEVLEEETPHVDVGEAKYAAPVPC